MNRIIYTCMAGLMVLMGAGCRKYVEIDQVGTRTLHYTKDYQALLNYTLVMEKLYYYPEMASDEVNISDTNFQKNMRNTDAYTYTWAPDIFIDVNDEDWDAIYKQIYYCNLVTAGITDSDGGTDAEKKNIYAQALAHRAFAFYTLVNIYAKQYDAATAGTDPGIPVLTVPDFTGSLKRATVKEVYDLVKSDLQAALPDLEDVPVYSLTASRAGVYSILARASLQQGLYADAEKYADSALARQHTLLNLADYAENPAGLPLKLQDPEIIFGKVMNTPTVPTFPLSDELLALFDSTDLRYKLFTADGANFLNKPFTGRGYYRGRISGQGIYVGTCVPEMMLIKAEAAARAGNTGPAMDVLNELRKHRYKPADYTELRVTDARAALRQVLNERSRELMGRGFRWFDQKRLNREADPATTVTRNFRGQTYTLAPNSNRYVFPIANIYIKMNPEITPNPR